MKKALLTDVSDLIFCITDKGYCKDNGSYITPASLLPYNYTQALYIEDKYSKNTSYKINNNDILIKRISPNYVNLIKLSADEIYATNNIIIVRPKDNISPKYLAYILNNNISKIISKAAKGTTMPTLNRQDLAEFEFVLPPLEKQKILGEIWLLSQEKRQLQERLSELETIKISYVLQKTIGGNHGK